MSKNNTQNLRRFNLKLQEMPTQVAAKVAERGAAAITTRAQASYDSGVSVYGEAYPRGLKLFKTGDTRRSMYFKNDDGTKIRCKLGPEYAIYIIHFGILPNGNAALPWTWQKVLREISIQELSASFAKVVAA